jgi:Spy/CpxP family protein refolding chaperone
MRRSVQIYLDHAKHLTPEQRKWLRNQEAKRANDKTRLKEARRIVREAMQ